jgi:rRNA maturation protein Nop10
VESSQYDLCVEILRRLEKAGVLKHLVLIGGWASLFYREYFRGVAYAPILRTRDMDLLVPKPGAIRTKVDVTELLEELGFVMGFTGPEGYIRLEHPELIVEFLVPERGRSTDKPYDLPQLGINAQSLRFLDFLAEEVISVTVSGMKVNLPHPARYSLHKLIISQRRRDEAKSQKDRQTAVQIIRAMVASGKTDEIRNAFGSMPRGWQTRVRKTLKEAGEIELEAMLSSRS